MSVPPTPIPVRQTPPRLDAWGQPYLEDLPEIDLSGLEVLLRLTPDQRLARHEMALEMALEFKAAGEKYRASLAQSPPTPEAPL